MSDLSPMLTSMLRSLLQQGAQGLVIVAGYQPRLRGGNEEFETAWPRVNEYQVSDLIDALLADEDNPENLEVTGSCEILYEFDNRYFDCEIRQGEHPGITFTLIDTDLLAMSAEDSAGLASVTMAHASFDDEPSSSGYTEPPWMIRPPVPGAEDVAPPAFEGLPSRAPRAPGSNAIDTYLQWMVRNKGTDMHLTPSYEPTLRIDNLFRKSDLDRTTPDQLRAMIYGILTTDDRAEFERQNSVDLGYSLQGIGRFRMSCFQQQNGPSISIRHIPEKVKSLADLGLPSSLGNLAEHRNGMLLFCGPTGSGKSTTQAALVRLINENQARHIITLEDPIEYVHHSDNCLIQQREVGVHAPNFARGLRDALREDPDVILVGELRDQETISMALAAAETGHLLMGTMHVNTTTNAITRLVDAFAEHERNAARAQIGESLRAVVNQRLLTHTSGTGLVPIIELMKINFAVAALIREGKMHQIKQVLTTSLAEGMVNFERSAAMAYLAGKITREDAERVVPDRNVFRQILGALRLKSSKRVEKLTMSGSFSAQRSKGER